MKILYVTGIWNGFDETILRGAAPGNGLPAFWKPLDYLLDQGHDVRFITIENDTISQPICSGDARIGSDRFLERVHYKDGLVGKLLSIRALKKAVRRALNDDYYDFVYLHGPTAGVCRGVAIERGVPVGQRLYGTFLWRDIKRFGAFACRFLRRNEFVTFKKSKCFLLVTNDGSGGDRVFQTISPSPPPFRFHYWVNGVDRPAIDELEELDPHSSVAEAMRGQYIFYCARFDRWKRQDRAVHLLSELSASKPELKLVFAGDDRGQYSLFRGEVQRLAIELGVEDRLVFLGHISRKEITSLHYHALASVFLFDVCNLTNALHEAVAAGGAVIVLNDETMSDYIVDGTNGFLCSSVDDAADLVLRLDREPDLRSALKSTARLWAQGNLLTWRERAQKEAELIISCLPAGDS